MQGFIADQKGPQPFMTLMPYYYIDTQKSAFFNWFGWVESCKYSEEIYIGGLL